MKPANVSQKPAVPGRNVIDGDVLYFRHAEHGALSGRVVSVGAHGVTLAHERGDNGQMRVLWEDVLGHKERRARKLTLVERGEDGAIAEDEDGKRVFVEGEVPDEPAEDEMHKAIPVAALQAAAGTVPAMSLREQAAIDAALISAGFVPSMEYIWATYGPHWSKRPEDIPPAPLVDLEPVIKSIAEVKAHADAGLGSLRSEMALALAGKASATVKYGSSD